MIPKPTLIRIAVISQGLTAILFSTAVSAQSSAEKIAVTDPLSSENLFRVFGGLVFVLILAVAAIWVLKKIQRFPVTASNGIKMVGSMSIGQRERLIVVQLGEEQLLLGVTPGSVNTLHVLQSPLPNPTGNKSERVFSFQEKLRSVIAQGKKS